TVFDIDPETWERIPDTVTTLPSEAGGIEVNEDGTMTVRYELRSDARWSDGVAISGADLAFTAEAMRDMALSGSGGVDPVMATVTATDSVEQIAFITFAEPTLAFEDALWIVLPSHSLAGVDLLTGTDGSDWPSGGPFIVDEFDSTSHLALVRNEFYWKTDASGESLPYLDGLSFEKTAATGSFGQEPISPVGPFLAGERDVISVPSSTDEISRIESSDEEDVVVETTATPIVETMVFQFGSGRDVANPESNNDSSSYRTAVAHALDRAALLAETGVPWIPDTPGLLIPIGPSAWDQYPYDVETGSALVEESSPNGGARSVLSTTGNGDYRIRIGDALATRFADISVEYETAYVDSVVFFGETLSRGTFDIGMWAWVNDGGYSSTLDLLRTLDPSRSPPDGNYARWGESGLSDSAQRFAEVVEAAESTLEPALFDELVAEAEGILADLAITIPLFQRASRVAYWASVVTGVTANGSQSDFTWNVETWQRVGE
ncbi:MAG: ABC transporter substrate-binding protein, partial [Acidimicrobiia bacterium]